jgi:hypothetical protein
MKKGRPRKRIANAQQMIDAARVGPEDFLFAIRQVLWIACVWNDHNFQDKDIRESARLCAQRLGCESVENANGKLRAMLERVQAERALDSENA